MSDELQREVDSLRQELAAAQRRAARLLARHQQQALAMEVIRQNNEELDDLNSELARMRVTEAARAEELGAAHQKLVEHERENEALIARLQDLVTQLSTPLLLVGPGILAVPIV